MYVLSRNLKNISFFLSENFPILVLKFSTYLKRRVFIMRSFGFLSIHRVPSENWSDCTDVKADPNLYPAYIRYVFSH